MKLTLTPSALLFGLLCALSLPACAQWQWLDNHGKRVFSDQAPPANVPEKDVLKRPGASNTSQPAQPPKPAPSSATAPTPAPAPITLTKPSGKDTELEKKKAQAEAEAAAKKKAEEQKIAATRADNCARAKSGLASLESGVRVSQINSQGEREYMSDEARIAETQRVQGIVASDCQ